MPDSVAMYPNEIEAIESFLRRLTDSRSGLADSLIATVAMQHPAAASDDDPIAAQAVRRIIGTVVEEAQRTDAVEAATRTAFGFATLVRLTRPLLLVKGLPEELVLMKLQYRYDALTAPQSD
jgi:hypothetical protein